MISEPVDIRGARALVPPLNVLRFFGDPVGMMLELERTHGPIAAVVDRRATLICAFGAALNQEVMTQPALFAHSTEFPVKSPPGSSLARFNQVLPFSNGEEHRRRRRLMQPAFQKAAIEGYAPDVVRVTDALLARWPLLTPVDVAAKVRELTAAIAIRALFGLDALDEQEDLAHVEASLLAALSSPLTIALPFAIPGLPFHRALALSSRVEQRLRELITARRAQGEGGTDALSRLMFAKDEDGASLSDDELVGECNGLFVAGYDTGAQTLAWTLFLLAQHPAALGALQEELDATLHGAPPTPADFARLPKLDAVIKESMRLLPAAPMLFMRVAQQQAKLGPHVVPKGTTLVLSPLVTHRAPERFPEPSRFLPDRWVGLEPSAYEYLPFGAGARMCLGAPLANLVLRLVLPMLLQRFRFELVAGSDVSRGMHGIALAPKHGLRFILSPQRNDPPPPSVKVRGDIAELVQLG
ncbi:MAG: cytochrome P450 [Myxococcota bacterium]